MRVHEDHPEKLSASWSVRIVATLVALSLFTIVLEAVAWGLYSMQESLRVAVHNLIGSNSLQLDSYEMPVDGVPNHWRLRPGYGVEAEDLVRAKSARGKWLGAEAIRSTLNAPQAPSKLFINQDGYKGPPIDPEHSCPRVLMIGDSTTFGMGGISYPFYAQQAFFTRAIGVEVVNAGVEGYSPRNALLEFERYRELQPEIVTIYIGWNALFASDLDQVVHSLFFKTPWLLDRASYTLKRLFKGNAQVATAQYSKMLNPNPDDPEIEVFRSTEPNFVADVEKIVDEFRKISTEVYLVTLYGLFQTNHSPSTKALEKGHLPEWTDNPFVMAALTDGYNAALRKLAERDGVHLIDLQAWGRENLQPPEDYFFDAVHFDVEGMKRVGAFLADELSPKIRAFSTLCLAGK